MIWVIKEIYARVFVWRKWPWLNRWKIISRGWRSMRGSWLIERIFMIVITSWGRSWLKLRVWRRREVRRGGRWIIRLKWSRSMEKMFRGSWRLLVISWWLNRRRWYRWKINISRSWTNRYTSCSRSKISWTYSKTRRLNYSKNPWTCKKSGSVWQTTTNRCFP